MKNYNQFLSEFKTYCKKELSLRDKIPKNQKTFDGLSKTLKSIPEILKSSIDKINKEADRQLKIAKTNPDIDIKKLAEDFKKIVSDCAKSR